MGNGSVVAKQPGFAWSRNEATRIRDAIGGKGKPVTQGLRGYSTYKTDMNIPTFDVIYPGDVLTRHIPLIAELGFPQKEVVSGRATFTVSHRTSRPLHQNKAILALGGYVAVRAWRYLQGWRQQGEVKVVLKPRENELLTIELLDSVDNGDVEQEFEVAGEGAGEAPEGDGEDPPVLGALALIVVEGFEPAPVPMGGAAPARVAGAVVVEALPGDAGRGEKYDYSKMGSSKVGPYTTRVVQAAKAKFGLLDRTVANRLMVQGWISAQMKEHGVRPSHCIRILPMATALTFVATEWDIEAKKLEATFAVHERHKQNTTWKRVVPRPWWAFWVKETSPGVSFTK